MDDNLQEWNRCRSIASDLLMCFTDKEVEFKDIEYKYPDIDFPPRSTCLMAVSNSKGDTRTKKINDIARWIMNWDEEEISNRALYGKKRSNSIRR